MYLVPDNSEGSPPAIAARLIDTMPEFAHLKDGQAQIRFLLDLQETISQGRQILGMVHIPSVQGRLKRLFDWMLAKLFHGEQLDFLITLDDVWWEAATEQQREILIFHELCHCIQKTDKEGEPRFTEEGRPVFGLLGHDVEEFSATVRRYGAYSPEIQEFIAAATVRQG